jgi:hypothetical protein
MSDEQTPQNEPNPAPSDSAPSPEPLPSQPDSQLVREREANDVGKPRIIVSDDF